MANLAQSAVTSNEVWYDGRNRKLKFVDATLVLTGQGGLTNLIPASLFGMSKIVDVQSARDSNNNPVTARASYVGNYVHFSAQAAPKVFAVTGVNGAGDITTTGVLATDIVESVVDLTTPGVKTVSQYTPGTDKVTQAVGAGDTSAKKLLITLRNASVPTDITATVRLIVAGIE